MMCGLPSLFNAVQYSFAGATAWLRQRSSVANLLLLNL